MRTIGVVTNPTSGSGRGAAWSSQALALLASRGLHVRDFSSGSWTASLENATRHRDEVAALVVVGGDGMAHLGVQVCATTDTPLGIVAAGSGNDVAATMGLPVHDIAGAVDAIERGLEGDSTRVDVGRVEGATVAGTQSTRYFAAVLSAGLDAAVSAYGNRLRFPRGPLKYKVATLRELPRFRPYGVRLEVDGEQWEQTCTLIAVANGPMFGGGLRVSPHSCVTDGALELLLAEPMSAWDVARIFPRLTHGTHLSDPRVRVISASRIRISAATPGAPLPAAFADGELVGPSPLDIRVAPSALTVLGAAPTSVEA
jgi:diacylglycerol kinase (ATP)